MSRIGIVGGGIAGLSAAAVLAKHGHEVLLFEAEHQLGYHASGRSAALFSASYGNELVRVLNRATEPVLSQMGALSSRGLLLVAKADQQKAFCSECEDMGLSDLSASEARSLVPILSDDVVYAAYDPSAKDIDTDAVLQAFARDARRYGAVIHTGAEIKMVRPGFHLQIDGSEVAVDLVVNAAGAWADDLAKIAGAKSINLAPLRRSMARLPAPGGRDVRSWPMLLGVGESWYAKPDAGGWLVSPAEEELVTAGDVWAEDMVLAEGLARYEAHVTEPVTRLETSWAGLRTFAPDRTLVIGEDPDCPGFYWLAGQGGYGFQTCAGAATHLAGLVSGSVSPLGEHVAQQLSPGRFMSSQA